MQEKIPYLYTIVEKSDIWKLSKNREEALIEAIHEAEALGKEVFWISVAALTPVPTIDLVDELIEKVEDAYAETIPPEEALLKPVSKSQIEELDAKMNVMIHDWIERHGLGPEWYTVKKKEVVRLGDADWPRLEILH